MKDLIKTMAHQVNMSETDLMEIVNNYIKACKDRKLTDEETMNIDNMLAYIAMMIKYQEELLNDEKKMHNFHCEVLDLIKEGA